MVPNARLIHWVGTVTSAMDPNPNACLLSPSDLCHVMILPPALADLLDSEPSSIASFNNFSSINSSIPSGYLVMVPVSCLCSGSIQQHNARYTLVSGDTYFSIAKDTYQGLTTCYKSIEVQNYYRPTNLSIGTNLVIPVR